ncbi:class I SAM-dependent methyltransferase [Tundrisphaera sp. TA3]|uniref:class I SAM-dependent methyltransferase n=1 Tax=Tundrisphaera sp. TA3 TaxID=3435775 RepID=UPI003EB9C45A
MDLYYGPSYYGRRHGVTAKLCIRRRLGLVRRWAGPADGRAWLDYGSGDGGFALAARGRGWDCWGLERRTLPTRPEVPIVGGLDDLDALPPLAGASFWHVLEHLEDPFATLGRLRERLEPNGLVLAAVPNFASRQSLVAGPAWLHLDLPRHLWHFTPESLRRAFEAAGYRVEGLWSGEIEYDVIGWSQGLLNRFFGGRNEFFHAMSDRPGRRGARAVFQVPAGVLLSALMAVPAWAEGLTRQAGTLLVAARSVPR